MITAEELTRRQRLGKLIAGLCIIWWVAAIGGIIYVIEINK